MLKSDYSDQVCSIARTLEVVGERWSLLILRDIQLGRCRFDELVAGTGVTRTVLTRRLQHLLDHGVLQRVPYQQRPERHEYQLTGKGQDLLPLLAHLMWWGDRYYPAPGGPPRVLLHRECGGPLVAEYSCGRCGRPVAAGDVVTEAGTGLLGSGR
jgi:DNA-binding HxlR family transcriptional regulator